MVIKNNETVIPFKARGKSVQVPKSKNVPEKVYLLALKEHWEGRPVTSIERLSKILASERKIPNALVLKLYRLWIEVLSESSSHEALKDLRDHLDNRAQVEAVRSYQYLALKGIIHYELDEHDAVRLILKAISAYEDPYVKELIELNHLRSQKGKKAIDISLWHMRENLADYFHFQTLARALHTVQDSRGQAEVITAIKNKFQGSPLPDVFSMHQAIEKKDLEVALAPALRLSERYPGNCEYRFNVGYIAASISNYPLAIKHLMMANELTDGHDVDILNWLGFSLSESAIMEGNRHNIEEACKILETAVDLSIHIGIPSQFPSAQLQKISRFLGQSGNECHSSRIWLIKLNAKKFYELKNSSIEEIKNARKSLGDEPQPGDLCLFVGDDYAAQSSHYTQLRLGAIYSVTSEPVWHPLYQFQSTMQLVSRPEISIPFEAETITEHEVSVSHQETVFEIEPAALGVIEEAIKEVLGEDSKLSNIFRDYKASV